MPAALSPVTQAKVDRLAPPAAQLTPQPDPWSQPWHRAAVFLLSTTALLGTALVTTSATLMAGTVHASPPPTPVKAAGYSLGILGFNDGRPYRIDGAQADAVLGDASAVLWRFKAANWMDKAQTGAFVTVADVTSRYPGRSAHEMVRVFNADLDGDGTAEVILVPRNQKIADKARYAPTILSRVAGGYKPLHAVKRLPGERFHVVDMRDLDGNGTPEILFSGEAGRRGYYHFHELLGRTGKVFAILPVKHVDSVHYVDLNRDGKAEVVVRQRVSRRGPPNHWTYVDQLYGWTGKQFTSANKNFPRYHDVQTLPKLVGELIDHYEAELPILNEKVKAIRNVRRGVMNGMRKPPKFAPKVVRALRDLEKGRIEKARLNLRELERQYPYDIHVLLGLARLHAMAALDMKDGAPRRARYELALDAAIRALTVDPVNREAWWWTGVSFIQVRERSSGLASLFNAVRLTGQRTDGLAFLRARRGEPGMDGELQTAIDDTLKALGRL